MFVCTRSIILLFSLLPKYVLFVVIQIISGIIEISNFTTLIMRYYNYKLCTISSTRSIDYLTYKWSLFNHTFFSIAFYDVSCEYWIAYKGICIDAQLQLQRWVTRKGRKWSALTCSADSVIKEWQYCMLKCALGSLARRLNWACWGSQVAYEMRLNACAICTHWKK